MGRFMFTANNNFRDENNRNYRWENDGFRLIFTEEDPNLRSIFTEEEFNARTYGQFLLKKIQTGALAETALRTLVPAHINTSEGAFKLNARKAMPGMEAGDWITVANYKKVEGVAPSQTQYFTFNANNDPVLATN